MNYLIGDGTYSVSHETLGVGASGTVMRGIHIYTQQSVAIKIIDKYCTPFEIDKEICSNEINHINVLKIHDIINSDSKLFIVFDLAEGGDLFDFINNYGTLSEKYVRNMFKQLILGLEACHVAGIVHRDIKPENILIRKVPTLDNSDSPTFDNFKSPDSIMISDFGLSNSIDIDDDGNESLLQTPCGSLLYAAPEVIMGRYLKYKSRPIDIWSVGIVLFVSIEGYFPFKEATKECSLFSNYKKNREYTFPSNFSNNLIELLFGMLTIDPDKRWNICEIKSSAWWNESNDINKNDISSCICSIS